MSKAILVIDMPEDCTDCPLCVETTHNYSACCISGSRIISYGKFPWCPLKAMPSMKKIDFDHDAFTTATLKQGWNDCVNNLIVEADK